MFREAGTREANRNPLRELSGVNTKVEHTNSSQSVECELFLYIECPCRRKQLTTHTPLYQFQRPTRRVLNGWAGAAAIGNQSSVRCVREAELGDHMARSVEIRQLLAPRIGLEAGKDVVVLVPLNDELLEVSGSLFHT